MQLSLRVAIEGSDKMGRERGRGELERNCLIYLHVVSTDVSLASSLLVPTGFN